MSDRPETVPLRIASPNATLTPEQLELLADLAERADQSFADLTVQQQWLLYGVPRAASAPGLAQLQAAGLWATEDMTPHQAAFIGCPAAGADRHERFDASPTILQLRERLAQGAWASWPGAVQIGVSACGESCVAPQLYDLALIGCARQAEANAEQGFDVWVGGDSAMPRLGERLGVFVPVSQAVDVVECLAQIWREACASESPAEPNRFAAFVQRWGAPRLREALQARFNAEPHDLAAPPALTDAAHDHFGVRAQRQPGRYMVGAAVVAGRITSRQMAKVADLCRRYAEPKVIRLTSRQQILLLNLSEAQVEKVLAALAEVELSINAHAVRRSLVVCPGPEGCGSAVVETKARARQILAYLERHALLDDTLRLHLDGCRNGCAWPSVAHIGLSGTHTERDGQRIDAFDIAVGGQLGDEARLNRVIAAAVPANECARRLEQLLWGFRRQRKSGESFNGWAARVNDAELARLLIEGDDHPLAETPATTASAA